MIYNILEVANTHAGDFNYMISLLEEYSKFNKKDKFGIKFQPLHFDKIATKDFEWYSVYKTLLFNEKEWVQIISKAFETKDVWIDLFDSYGVQILKNNFDKVKGIKLQVSILFNEEVLSLLEELDFSDKEIIINIASFSKEEIEERYKYFKNKYNPSKLHIEVGFQSYPTQFLDSGLNKVVELSEEKYSIVFADHLSPDLEDCTLLPVMASLNGASLIEKHIMHSTLDTKYDYFSSMKIDQYERFIDMLNRYQDLMAQPIVNKSEIKYYEDSLQIPLLKNNKKSGEIISKSDLIYKRSGKVGLKTNQLSDILKNDYFVLNTDKKEEDSLSVSDFKRATIATIIACRLKSTRLKNKAKLKIGDNLTSIEMCIKNTLKFKNVNHTVLATSITEEDAELEKFTYSDNVIFHKGSADDVITRYLDIIDTLKVDVFIRVTGDCPYIPVEIQELLLKSHFETGADYTTAKNFAVGTAVEVISVPALKKIKEYFGEMNYSEYMTWYLVNNPEFFKINKVDLPKELIREDYRLTLDYQEDLDLFNELEKYLCSNKLDFNASNMFEFFDNNPEVVNLNSHLTLKYKVDSDLISMLDRETKMKINE